MAEEVGVKRSLTDTDSKSSTKGAEREKRFQPPLAPFSSHLSPESPSRPASLSPAAAGTALPRTRLPARQAPRFQFRRRGRLGASRSPVRPGSPTGVRKCPLVPAAARPEPCGAARVGGASATSDPVCREPAPGGGWPGRTARRAGACSSATAGRKSSSRFLGRRLIARRAAARQPRAQGGGGEAELWRERG